MNVGLSDAVQDFENLADAVDSAGKGFNSGVGKVKINFKSDEKKLIDDRKQLKVAQLSFKEDDIKLSRIDGNHRLSAAEYLANDILIPFCLIIFPNDEEAKNHIADAKNVGIDDIISIFDKVYDNIPNKVFLARWYPALTTGEIYEKA